jgi:hypothetical protein
VTVERFALFGGWTFVWGAIHGEMNDLHKSMSMEEFTKVTQGEGKSPIKDFKGSRLTLLCR